MLRALLILVIGFLIAAAAYTGTTAFLHMRLDEPFRSRTVPRVWPLPDSTEPHPFWPRFPDLGSPKPERRDAALEALLRLEADRLPHPARKPEAWPLALRIQAHALLWRLYRGKAYRLEGLELDLSRPAPEPLKVGAPPGFRLTLENVRGAYPRSRVLPDLDRLVQAGARIHVVTRPPGRLRLGPPPATPDRPIEPARLRGVVPLSYAPLDQAAFTAPGDCSVVVAVDLTDARLADLRLPRGILVSNALRIRVTAR